ncbi:MAG TPA: hypothetical protein PL143_02745 [Rhodocyclaceae bacterium]|nr:hypothetical protein [Rhodocyclaceae bacterium]
MSNLGHMHHRLREAERRAETPAHPPLPEVYMPAMPPLGLINAIEEWVRAWMRRRQLLKLLDYDDRILDDFGYPRRELLWAASLPLKVNAYELLRKRREQRLHDRRRA